MGRAAKARQHLAELRRWQLVVVGMRKDGAKPSISNHIPRRARAGVHSHHILTSPILQKWALVLETQEGSVSGPPWLREIFP